jgi:hypothetical protein
LTTVASATNYTPGDVTTETNMPTFHWDNSRYIRDEHDLVIPAATPPQAYALRVGLLDPAQGGALIPLADGTGDTAWADHHQHRPGDRTGTAWPTRWPPRLQQTIADTIALSGYEVTGQTPDELRFTTPVLAGRTAPDAGLHRLCPTAGPRRERWIRQF